MEYLSYIIFDLDGTLIDPREGVLNAVRHALNKFGIEEKNDDTILSFIGPPLYISFHQKYGLNEEDAEKAVMHYREYYGEKGYKEHEVYGGVTDVLKNLKEKGKKIYIATSKPGVFARKIIESHGLKEYFEYIEGPEVDEAKLSKTHTLERLLERGNIGPARAIMIGDSPGDMKAGKEFGMKTLGAAYGYTKAESLKEAGADFIAHEVKSILKILNT